MKLMIFAIVASVLVGIGLSVGGTTLLFATSQTAQASSDP
jgi:hypothetical protein